MSDGVETSYRVPVFDLEISAQQENSYKTMEYNQLALQLFQMGFFREDMAPQALRCLELMDFKNKDLVMAMIRNGQTQQMEIQQLRQRLMQAAAVVDQVKGTHLAQQLAQEYAAAQKTPRAVPGRPESSTPWSVPGAAPGRRCGPDDPGDGGAGAADPGGTCGICSDREGHCMRGGIGPWCWPWRSGCRRRTW